VPFFFILILALISAWLSQFIASAKGWSGFNWFWAGFFFGPIGLLGAVGLPDRKLRHYLYELSKRQGVSREALGIPDKGSQVPQVIDAPIDECDFTTDPLTSVDDAWRLIFSSLPEAAKKLADRSKSEITLRSSVMIIFSADGKRIAEAKRIHKTKDSLVYWKVSCFS
jgi:hypothetical protein